MDAARGTLDGDIVVQVRRRGDGDGVDAVADQRLGVVECGAAEIAGDGLAAFAVGIGDADQFHTRQFGQHTGMVAAHDAHAHNTDTQRISAHFLGITHDAKSPLLPRSQPRSPP